MEKPSKHIAWILFLISLLLLYYTSYPSIGWWDSGEYAVSAYNLSIPSPGGSIIYILLGRLFIIILFFLSSIKAITLVSIISTSFASVFFYFTLAEILKNIKDENSASIQVVSFITALSLPFLFSIWSEANVSRVYTLGLLLTSIIFFCAVKIWFADNEYNKQKYFLLIIFLLSLDYSAHRLNMPFIPFLLILLLFPLRKNLLSVKFWMLILLVIIIGFFMHVFLLIRSAQGPPLRIAETNTLQDLFSWITMKRFGQSNLSILFQRRAPFWDYQINYMYLRYFGWNFLLSNGNGIFHSLIFLSFIPFLLGIIGFIYSLIKKINVWTIVFTVFFFFSFGLIVYSNTSEGFHNIREIDRLFIPSFMIYLFWAGIGLFFLFSFFTWLFKKINTGAKFVLPIMAVIGFIILPLNLILTNWKICDKSDYYFPEDFAFNILSSCNKNSVLFTNGDNDTFPLFYLQDVEGYRKDVSVVNVSLLNTDFYVRDLVNSKNGFTIDTALLNPNEFGPSLLKQPEEIVLPNNGELLQRQNIKDTLHVVYDGRKMGNSTILLPQDKIILSFLRENKWKRPVYFCSTVMNENLLGLNDYLNLEGIVRRLVPVKGEKITPVNLEKNLMFFYRYRGLNNKDVILDKTTKNLFFNFRAAFNELKAYYLNKGNIKKAEETADFMQIHLPDWRFDNK